MKKVIQLNSDGYFVGVTYADESPLEPGVYLMPMNTIDANVPEIPENKLAKWNGSWVFEDIVIPEVIEEEVVPLTYAQKRELEYPDFRIYLDGIVKGDQEQVNQYIADCLAVKAKYPKPESA